MKINIFILCCALCVSLNAQDDSSIKKEKKKNSASKTTNQPQRGAKITGADKQAEYKALKKKEENKSQNNSIISESASK